MRISPACLAVLAACGGAPEPAPTATSHIPSRARDKLDVLFVVDSSLSMLGEQPELAEQFERYVAGLTRSGASLPDLHLAVISTDLGAGGHADVANCTASGDDGRFRRGEGDACGLVAGDFITDAPGDEGTRQVNYTGTLAEAFTCMAMIGPGGCGFEQPLASLVRALEREQGAPTGFLRPEAALAVVLIGDEDDCSAWPDAAATVFDPSPSTLDDPLGPLASYRCFEFGVVCEPDAPREVGVEPVTMTDCRPREDSPYLAPPSEFVDRLLAIKADPGAISVTVMNGDPTPEVQVALAPEGDQLVLRPSCSHEDVVVAAPAIRLASFAAAFGPLAVQASICSDDLGPELEASGGSARAAAGRPCLVGALADVDAAAPAVQPACRVAAVTRLGQPDETRTEVPACGSGQPCWRAVPDAAQCGDLPSALRLEVDRAGEAPRPEVTYVADCDVAPAR